MIYSPNLPQTSWKKQLVDQTAHAFVAFWIIMLVLVAPNALTAFMAGLAIGMVREFTQHGTKMTKWIALDLFFWGVGGAIAFWAFK